MGHTISQRMEIDQLKKEMEAYHPSPPSSLSPSPPSHTSTPPTPASTTSSTPVKMLVRKEADNHAAYFDKTYAEYQEGFSANGLLKQQSIQILTKSLRRELAWP